MFTSRYKQFKYFYPNPRMSTDLIACDHGNQMSLSDNNYAQGPYVPPKLVWVQPELPPLKKVENA